MIHFQKDALTYLTLNNSSAEGKPIINVGDLIIFSEENSSSNSFIAYDVFFALVGLYFEYFEIGTRRHQVIRVTGLLTKFQNNISSIQ
ncbi:hypothetical protein FO440_22010 [Mucilaginibacter corticis]|uniref:Uncharacterized protein n=1 Tax=Mucilaginibacter corticis TaxID=2597670 RepID=A0A556M9D4_9SPHI|nr:hypothetical protein [Mucilaginibacter corticis]TSJ36510.1 hypothetical protein FO440_22010 [Mucilaginibacter corticis]